MKKRLLFTFALVLALALVLSIVAFAKDYTVNTADELKSALGEINDTSSTDLIHTITFGGNISSSAIGITRDVEVVIDLNGFTFTQPTNAGGTAGSALHTDTTGAKATIKNGKIDVNDVCFWPARGLIVAQDLDIISHNEETVWWGDNQNGSITLINCIIDSNGIAMLSKGGCASTTVPRVIIIENCTIDGTVTISCASKDSYMKNTTVTGAVTVDAWHNHGGAFHLENVTAPSLTSISGSQYTVATDCKIDSFIATSDGSGKSKITTIISPTCSETGTQTIYIKDADPEVTSLDIIDHGATNDDDCTTDIYCEMCKQVLLYPATAQEHDIQILSIVYNAGFGAGGQKSVSCKNCTSADEIVIVSPIFVAKGYSCKEDTTNGYGIAGGYEINHTARAEYEQFTGTTLNFGVIMFNVGSNQAKALESALFQNGKLTITEKALQVDATNSTYTMLNFAINGFEGDALALELAISLYVTEITGEGESASYETTFVQSSEKTSGIYEKGGASLTTVTYYSISGTTPPSEE